MDGTTGMLDFHGEMWIHFHQGICIDIFPLDEVPSDAETEKKFREELESKIYTLKSSVYFNILHPFRSLRLMRNFDKFTVECEDCSRRYNDGSHDKIAILSVNCISRNKSWYDETVYLPFEYLSIPVPTCYHDNLSAQYGDYMTPVQGSTEHAFWILDPDTDYHNYLPEQKRIFNKIRRNNLVKRVKNIIKRILCKNS
jgi:lipopolysaccharide cholinephosphotransferase